MKRRVSKAVREQAALICAIAASNGHLSWEVAETAGVKAEDASSMAAWVLAIDVCYFTRDAYGTSPSARTRAEAEAMLRTGWSPE